MIRRISTKRRRRGRRFRRLRVLPEFGRERSAAEPAGAGESPRRDTSRWEGARQDETAAPGQQVRDPEQERAQGQEGAQARGDDERLLAQAAHACPALRSAARLTDWIGDGRVIRTVPVLYPVQVATAVRALGADEPAVVAPAWARAQHAGFIETRGESTVPGPNLEAWRDGGPSTVLQLWREAYERYTGLGGPGAADGQGGDALGEPYVRPEAFGAQAALRLLAAGRRPLGEGELSAKVARVLRRAQRGLAVGLLDPVGHGRAGLDLLVDFGAVARDCDRGTVRLTPLGRWLVESRRQAGGEARGLVAYLSVSGRDVAGPMAQRWLAGRNPADAVRELLTLAAEGDAAVRSVAIELAVRAGAAAEPEWRRWLEHPWVGPHARVWVAKIVDGQAPAEADADWALVDRFAGILRRDDDPELREALRWHCHELFGLDAVRRLGEVEHSDTPLLVTALTERHAFQRYARLRVELRDVDDPPVRRHLLVPAECTLAELHRALQVAMGWDGRHEGVFEVAGQEYGSYGVDPTLLDSAGPRLRELVSAGDTFEYEYDELERWRHSVAVESTDEEPPGHWALVVDGTGVCPPPDCGGPEGYGRLRQAVRDPDDPEAGRARQLLGVEGLETFDPSDFDPSLPNAVFAADTRRVPEERSAA